MDSFHEFFTALSSNTEGLADSLFVFLKTVWNVGGDFLLGSSAPAEPTEPTSVPLVPLEPATPTTPDVDPAE